jgi:hypothetical protein
MEAIMVTSLEVQASTAQAGRIGMVGNFARRFYARRMEMAQMRFAPTRQDGFCRY